MSIRNPESDKLIRICVSCMESTSRRYLAIFGCKQGGVTKHCEGCLTFNHCQDRLVFPDEDEMTSGLCQKHLRERLKK